jgi:hypothetical protein
MDGVRAPFHIVRERFTAFFGTLTQLVERQTGFEADFARHVGLENCRLADVGCA